MKTLTLIRHAKSSWSDPTLRDHDRPLNKRGLRDAPFMANLLVEKGWQPDQLVSSTALRARTTAQYFAEALGRQSTHVLQQSRIYHAGTALLQKVIHDLDNEWDSVALFGHNPGMTMLTNLFYKGDFLDNLPTCGIVEIVGANVTDWAAFSGETADVRALHFPKQYF
ncbi:MAG: histidine phosphatase family protein [Bacteroidota bacterium]